MKLLFFGTISVESVIPAKAGIQKTMVCWEHGFLLPAFVGDKLRRNDGLFYVELTL